jgi:hypothetical protein
MRRFLAAALPILALLVVLYVIGSAGSARHTKSTSPRLLPPAQQAATTTSPPTTTPQQATPPPPSAVPPNSTSAQTTTVITANRTDCRWRRYRDGAIGTDPGCAPGELDPAVTRNTPQTVCSRAWVTAASRRQPPPITLDKLLIEYQLPGNPVTYALARVIPVEDGGSPTSTNNLYPLPLNGFGGQQTRTAVANQLHDEICSHKITVTQAAQTLEGDWLSKGLPGRD